MLLSGGGGGGGKEGLWEKRGHRIWASENHMQRHGSIKEKGSEPCSLVKYGKADGGGGYFRLVEIKWE